MANTRRQARPRLNATLAEKDTEEMGLARFRGEWCHTNTPYKKLGIVLQAPPYAIDLAVFGFHKRDNPRDEHMYRHFTPDDQEIRNIEFYGPATWNGIKVDTTGMPVFKERGYVWAIVYGRHNAVPPPDKGTWDVEQYGSSVAGWLAIDHLVMNRMPREQCQDYVSSETANQAL